MATVYRRKDCNVHHYEFTDFEGIRRTAKGFKDKAETKRFAEKVEQQHQMVRQGYLPVTAIYVEVPLETHLTAFEDHLRAKGKVGEEQISLKMARIRNLLEKMEAEKLHDISADEVSKALATLRTGAGKEQGLSAQTSNHYLTDIKQFATWCRKQKRGLTDDPLATIDKLNVETDRRHDRRALTDDEVSRLLTATMTNGVVLGFSASDRAALYVFALYTGLRASELASLTPESIELDTVTVQAGYSKRRRLDMLPIPSAVIGEIRAWLAGKTAGQPLWSGDWAKHRYAGKLLQADLIAAKIPYQDSHGLFADFHALRHTYITNLARHDVPLATAQKLARHSTPVLTAKRYTHLDLQHQAKAADRLPALQCQLQWNGVPEGQNLSADGTEGKGRKRKKNPKNPANDAGNKPLLAPAPLPVCAVFKTGAIDRSATSPGGRELGNRGIPPFLIASSACRFPMISTL